MDGNVKVGGGELAVSVASIPDPYLKVTDGSTPSTGPRKISLSEMVEYRDCRRRWYLHHKLGLSKRDKSGALALGTNVHSALQVYYTPGGTAAAALEHFNLIYWHVESECSEYELEDVQKDRKLGQIMLEGYFEWCEETGVDQFLEIIEAEAEIEYLIDVGGTPIIIMGKRDLIGKNLLTGTNALVDHKTCASFNDNLMDLNEQVRMYLLLMRLVGSTVVQEAIWNKLRKVQRSARAKPPFYERQELYVSEEELRRFFTRIRGVIRDILMTEAQLADGQDPYEFCYPRPSAECSWKCQFRKVCPLMDQDPEAAQKMLSDMFDVEDPYLRYKDQKGAA